MSPLVSSVRLVEALDEYRKNGLNYFQYINCKNFALSNIIPHLLKMSLDKKESGFIYINPKNTFKEYDISKFLLFAYILFY